MDKKYVAMDTHFATITGVVLDMEGKKLIHTVLQTKEDLIRDFLTSLSGSVYLTFEEGTLASWLYEIAEPLVREVVVCNPRHNSLLKDGSKSDSIDAEKLAELLRLGSLKAVYHHRSQVSELKQLVAIYGQLTADRTRVINRLRAVFRSQALSVELSGKIKRDEFISKLVSGAQRQRAGFLFAELDVLDQLQKESRKKMEVEARRHPDYRLLQTMPGISSIRAAQLLAWGVTATPLSHQKTILELLWSECDNTRQFGLRDQRRLDHKVHKSSSYQRFDQALQSQAEESVQGSRCGLPEKQTGSSCLRAIAGTRAE
jgi:hypothetical protein